LARLAGSHTDTGELDAAQQTISKARKALDSVNSTRLLMGNSNLSWSLCVL
jgi:hypothetical protein